MKANSVAARRLLSLYIDNDLPLKKQKTVERLLETDAAWKAEYQAMKKTRLLLESVDKLAVPDDMVKRITTSVALSKSTLLKRFTDKFAFTLPRSPVFHYLGLVMALTIIVLAGSNIILKDKQKEQEEINRFVRDRKAMDSLISKKDKELAKGGYRWYHFELDSEGSWKIRHIGKSPAKSAPHKEEVTKKAKGRRESPPDLSFGVPSPKASLAQPARIEDKERAGAGELMTQKNADGIVSAEKTKRKQKTGEKTEKKSIAGRQVESRKPVPALTEETEIKAGLKQPPAIQEKSSIKPTIKEKAETLKRKSLPSELKRGSVKEPYFHAETDSKITSYPTLLELPNLKKRLSLRNKTLIAIVYLDMNGEVTDVVIRKSTGESLANNFLKRALMKARFSPARTEHGPVACEFSIKVEVK